MTLPYGVLKCTVVDWKITSLHHGKTTQYHLNVLVDVGTEKQRIAINVGTSKTSDIMVYRMIESFNHPFLAQLDALPLGLRDLGGLGALPALDFLRNEMSGSPSNFDEGDVADARGTGQPCHGLLAWLAEAQEEGSTVYAFGRYWDDSKKQGDKATPSYWPEESGRGIHDIHMNQGSTGTAYTTRDDAHDHNEIWQDGALFVRGANGWRAFFSAFSGQEIPTENDTGNPTADSKPL